MADEKKKPSPPPPPPPENRKKTAGEGHRDAKTTSRGASEPGKKGSNG